MIHANELMIGDWVLINGTPRKIQAVDGVDDEIMADDELYTLAEDRYHSEDKVEGVPITAEILEKNGLKPDTAEDAYAFRHLKDDISVLECYANAGSRYRCIIAYGETRLRKTICFVHELQHAMRLCEIDKTIVL